MDIQSDNGDLHQHLLAEQAAIICPKCPIHKMNCLKYTLDPSLNIAINLNLHASYEDPGGLIHCDPLTQICSPGAKAVKDQTIFVAVRSFVTAKCPNPYPPPQYFVFTTIKTILYRFNTDEAGNINGTIWAAPPFDEGMPYVEYLDSRMLGVYEGVAISTQSSKIAKDQLDDYPPRYANSVILPSICFTNDPVITCAGQTFDPGSYTLTMDALYKEFIEPRTFFFDWRARLSTVRQRWVGWGITDTCSPLKAVWLSNWNDVCTADPSNCKVKDSGCITSFSNFECTMTPPAGGDAVLNPSIYLRPLADGHESWIKWKAEFPYHESGHWLWFLMQGNHYYGGISTTTARSLTATMKCRSGTWASDPLTHLDTFSMDEAFAESHLLNFALVKTTGYSIYERPVQGEVDTACKIPFPINSGIPDDVKTHCPQCSDCSEPVSPVHILGTTYDCPTYYDISCTGAIQTPCNSGSYGTQAALLMDVYDGVNARYYDGDQNGVGQDLVHMPLGSIAKCFFDLAQGGNPPALNSNIGGFLDDLISQCGGVEAQINTLRNFFGAPRQ